MISLDTIPFFQSLSRHDLSFLESMTQERILEANQILFSEGEEANAFYILVKGNLSVFHPCPGPGKCKTVGMVRPGEFVGEMALLSDERHSRNASVRAEEPSMLIVFPSFVIGMVRQKQPHILESLQKIVRERMDMNKTNESC